MPEYTIPLGALLAAEHAYASLDEHQRNQPALVAELLLQAAAPFTGPIAAQLGRGRITERASAEIFRDHLKGVSAKHLADIYAVTPQTIFKHIRRRVQRELARSRAGVPVARIARRLGCPVTVLVAEFKEEIRREKAEPCPIDNSTELPVWIDDQDGAVVPRRRRSDAGRRRSRSRGLPGDGGRSGGVHDQAA